MDLSFNQLIQELKNTFETQEYKNELIRRTMKEKPKIRKTYTIVLTQYPCRLGDIKEKTFATKNSIYSHLYALIELGLVEKISIMDIWNREKLDSSEKEVLKKFKDWTKTMAKGQIQYFAGKTNYFTLTSLGKDTKIIEWVLKLERESRAGGFEDES